MPDITVGDVRLAYDAFGEGDPVLLICGTGQMALTWQLFQVPALTEAGYRVVTFDNRGIPPSDCPPAPYSVKQMAEDAAGVIEKLTRVLGPTSSIEIGGSGSGREALDARPDRHRDHVLLQPLLVANTPELPPQTCSLRVPLECAVCPQFIATAVP